MKRKYLWPLCILLLLGTQRLQAQSEVPATGGDATGAGGYSSYTIGQVNYTAETGSTGSVNQGIQQAYEIYTITGVEDHAVQVEMSVFPNPTTHFLNLRISHSEQKNLNYQLYDLKGKVLEKGHAATGNTQITEHTSLREHTCFP